METIIYQIEFNDGRTFRVFCANSTQKSKVLNSYSPKIKGITVITNGIHTVKEYQQILKTI